MNKAYIAERGMGNQNSVINNPDPVQVWEDNEKKSVMLYAKALTIIWSSDPRYWKWVPEREKRGTFDVAVLKMVWWFEVNAKFDTKKLTPDTEYEVFFVVMVKDSASGWEQKPTTVKIGEKKIEVDLMTEEKMKWIKIPVGKVTSKDGEINISMMHTDGCKEGIVIKGFQFEPKDESKQQKDESKPPKKT